MLKPDPKAIARGLRRAARLADDHFLFATADSLRREARQLEGKLPGPPPDPEELAEESIELDDLLTDPGEEE